MKNIGMYVVKGRYYLGRPEHQWQIVVNTPFGSVSYVCEEEPDISDMLPRQVLDLIEERSMKAWIDTARDERNKKIALLREHGDVIDKMYITQLLNKAKATVASLEKQLEDYSDCVIPKFEEA